MNKKKVFNYIYDKKLVDVSKNIPNIGNRALIVQSLVASYNLHTKCVVCSCEEATDEDLLSFHSSDYIDYLKKAQCSSDIQKLSDCDSELIDFNLGYDCPLFSNIYYFSKLIVGSSITAAKKLVNRNFKIKRKVFLIDKGNIQPKSYLKLGAECKSKSKSAVTTYSFEDDDGDDESSGEDKEENLKMGIKRKEFRRYETEILPLESNVVPISINWFGGWHHAQRDEAGGFCYVNDIVIAIQFLLKFFKRVLYIDLDVHHGDGVENAFLFSPRVLTLSFHKYESGYYPGSGSLKDVGEGNGKYYTVNVPLKGGITDEKYVSVFKEIFSKVMEKFQPYCLVVQCGADCLAGDPLGGFNLTSVGLGDCLRIILDKNLPTLVLGGGGYNVTNVSRCWTYLTSIIVESPISTDIPDHPFLQLYGPDYEIGVSSGLRKDENTKEYLRFVTDTVLRNLDHLPVLTTPSNVQQSTVPSSTAQLPDL